MDMMHVISTLVLLGLVFTAAFFQFPIILWTIVIGAALIAATLLGALGAGLLIFFWLIYLAAAVFANLSALRQRHITRPALNYLRKQIPSISSTERAAIEAGDTWWEKELFCGRPRWKNLFNIPRPTLSTEEENFLANQTEHLCAMLNDWEIVFDHRDLPETVWSYLKQEKFFGMVIPKQYGGLGFSALAHSTVITKLATRSVSTAVTTMVPNSLGPGELLLHYGTEEQKNYYLPRLANGREVPCFALTGPDAGSDAGAITDTGIVCRDKYEGKEVVGIRLSWDKRYITLAPVATVLGLAFRLYDPEKLLGAKQDLGISLCLIPTSHPGVEIGHRHFPMNLAFMNGPTRGHDVFIPLDWIIGGTDMIGQGWRMLMECLSIGRSISLPALSTGSSKLAYRLTGAYAKVRRQFNASIASFEGVEEALGEIAGCTYMLDACRMMTAGAIDQKINPSIVSAIAKFHMTEMCRRSVSAAMDIHAGHMIQVGPRNFLANTYYAIPISITVEGANILTRNLIIFGQGAIRCHPYLLKEVELITAANENVPELDRVLMSHIGFFTSNLLRNFAYGLTAGHFIFTKTIKNKHIKKYQRQLSRMSAALALLADTSLMILGGSLKRRERISARLGDIMSQLYVASTVLKYYNDHQQPTSDLNYVSWSLQHCLYRIQLACDELAENFPLRWLGRLLHFIIFPFGKAYHAPKDRTNHAIVSDMLTSSALRDRLTRHCFVSKNENDISYRLDTALSQIPTMEPIWKKLQNISKEKAFPHWYDFSRRVQAAKQIDMITTEEANLLIDFEQLRNEIIKVNEFSFDLNTVIT